MILAMNIADSITLKTSLRSADEEKSAAYVKDAIIKVFREPVHRRKQQDREWKWVQDEDEEELSWE